MCEEDKYINRECFDGEMKEYSLPKHSAILLLIPVIGILILILMMLKKK